MDRRLERFIDDSFVYRFMQNPDVVHNEEDARLNGLNCITLAHLSIKNLFQRELPKALLCAEMYADREYFDHIEDLDKIQQGDLVWFGVDNPKIEADEFIPQYSDGKLINWRDFPVKHVAVYTGERNDKNEELLLHSTYYEGTNVVWPISKFLTYPKYRRIYGVSRLRQ